MKRAWLKWVGLSLAVMGYFTPWINPVPAALKLSGYDLVEWLTFTAGVRDGSFAVSRVDMLWPLICLSWLLAHEAQQHKALRLIFVFLSFLCAASVLPQYPFILTAYSDLELRPQLIAGCIALAGAPIFASLKTERWQWRLGVGGSLAVGGLVCTLRAFALAQPAIQDAFGASVPIGFGIILSSVGFSACIIFYALGLYGRMREIARV